MSAEIPRPRPTEGKYTRDLLMWAEEFKHSLLTPLSGYLAPVLNNEEQAGYWALYYLFGKYKVVKERLPNHRDSTIEFSLTGTNGVDPEQGVASVIVWQVHKHDDQKKRVIADSIGWIKKTSRLRSNAICPSYPRYIGAVRTTYMPEYIAKMAKKELSGADGTEFFYLITTHTGVSYERTFKEMEAASKLQETAELFVTPLVEWYSDVILQMMHAILCACQWYGHIFVPNENNHVKISDSDTAQSAFLEYPHRLNGTGKILPLYGRVNFLVTNDYMKDSFGEPTKLHARTAISSAEWIDLKIYTSLSAEGKKAYRPITAALFDMVTSIIPSGAIPPWLFKTTRAANMRREKAFNRTEITRAVFEDEDVSRRLREAAGLVDWDFWAIEGTGIGHILKFVYNMWQRSVEWEKQLSENGDFETTQWGIKGPDHETDFLLREMHSELFFGRNELYLSYFQVMQHEAPREVYTYFPKPFTEGFEDLAL